MSHTTAIEKYTLSNKRDYQKSSRTILLYPENHLYVTNIGLCEHHISLIDIFIEELKDEYFNASVIKHACCFGKHAYFNITFNSYTVLSKSRPILYMLR